LLIAGVDGTAGTLKPLKASDNHWHDGVPKWDGDQHNPQQWDYVPP